MFLLIKIKSNVLNNICYEKYKSCVIVMKTRKKFKRGRRTCRRKIVGGNYFFDQVYPSLSTSAKVLIPAYGAYNLYNIYENDIINSILNYRFPSVPQLPQQSLSFPVISQLQQQQQHPVTQKNSGLSSRLTSFFTQKSSNTASNKSNTQKYTTPTEPQKNEPDNRPDSESKEIHLIIFESAPDKQTYYNRVRNLKWKNNSCYADTFINMLIDIPEFSYYIDKITEKKYINTVFLENRQLATVNSGKLQWLKKIINCNQSGPKCEIDPYIYAFFYNREYFKTQDNQSNQIYAHRDINDFAIEFIRYLNQQLTNTPEVPKNRDNIIDVPFAEYFWKDLCHFFIFNNNSIISRSLILSEIILHDIIISPEPVIGLTKTSTNDIIYKITTALNTVFSDPHIFYTDNSKYFFSQITLLNDPLYSFTEQFYKFNLLELFNSIIQINNTKKLIKFKIRSISNIDANHYIFYKLGDNENILEYNDMNPNKNPIKYDNSRPVEKFFNFCLFERIN